MDAERSYLIQSTLPRLRKRLIRPLLPLLPPFSIPRPATPARKAGLAWKEGCFRCSSFAHTILVLWPFLFSLSFLSCARIFYSHGTSREEELASRIYRFPLSLRCVTNMSRGFICLGNGELDDMGCWLGGVLGRMGVRM